MGTDVATFEPFGLQHWLGTAIAVAVGVLVPMLLRWRADPQGQDTARKIIAICLIVDTGLGTVMRAGVYGLPLLEHLPLQLCGMSVILGAFMLWLRSYRLYEVLYFWGTGGVLTALLTPDVEQAFPHPLFLLFFLSHGLAFMAVMFATLVMGFRPRAASFLIVMPVTAACALLMYPVNLMLGSNYLFLLAKPGAAVAAGFLRAVAVVPAGAGGADGRRHRLPLRTLRNIRPGQVQGATPGVTRE